MSRGCCAPTAPATATATVGHRMAKAADAAMTRDRVPLVGATFLMGSDDPLAYPEDGEGPVRSVDVGAFAIDRCAVSNERFSTFISATGYETEAERIGWSFVFEGLLRENVAAMESVAEAPWWRAVRGASWAHPYGPGSNVADRADHPVVHVSWQDAVAFCEWDGSRLPTEAEWEYAARGGLVQRIFPWGDALTPGGTHRMNVWQGTFPTLNSGADGYLGTAPVDAFEPNGFGLFNMTGNVWEWCADPITPRRRSMRGGSYLCHESYCRRYRVAARSFNTPDSSAGNVGFRTVVL
jgi:sulfatase modifying factor 1